MTLSMTQIKALLIRHEGLRTKVYKDSRGKLTIGIGRNLEDKGISVDEAMMLLENDVKEVIQGLKREIPEIWSKIDDVRRMVLIDMAFNLGVQGLLEFKRMLSALRQRDYKKAAEEMVNSLWCKQVGVRCRELVEMMRTGRSIV